MNEKIENPSCNVCGDDTTLHFVKSSGMDIEPTGLFATCMRCGNKQRVKALVCKNLSSHLVID